jgi:hypothetical protein
LRSRIRGEVAFGLRERGEHGKDVMKKISFYVNKHSNLSLPNYVKLAALTFDNDFVTGDNDSKRCNFFLFCCR